jgi:hypothetical protein
MGAGDDPFASKQVRRLSIMNNQLDATGIENRPAEYGAMISLAVLLISSVIGFCGLYLLLQFFSKDETN